MSRQSSKRTRKPAPAPPPKPAKSLNWLLVVVAAALVGTVAFAVQHHRAQPAAPVDADAPAPATKTPVPVAVMDQLSGIPTATWESAGVTGATAPVFVHDTPQQHPKAVVLYMGAGFCPYCAAARWSIITALARFGTFSGLTYDESSLTDVYPGTPTFSFYGSSYTSPYVDFQSLEVEGDVQLPDGRYAPLESPNVEQEALIERYDAPPYATQTGSFPFLLVGERYMWSGSPFSPGLLAGLSQATVAAGLASGSTDVSHAILVNANQLAAAICAVDGNQPADVCNTPLMRQAARALPTKTP